MPGFIGLKDLTRTTLPVKFGTLVSPLQAMVSGDGIAQEIEVWERSLIRSRLVERRLMNPRKMRIWREGYAGVWRHNGVWDLDEKERVRLLKPHHFFEVNGRAVDFSRDYIRPFTNRYAAGIRSVDPDALIFLETDPLKPPPQWSAADAPNLVYAPHWYDATVLFLKTYSPWIGFDVHTTRIVLGAQRVQKSFARQLGRHKEYAKVHLGNVPTIIGEIGIAFDMNRGRAYRTGDYRQQVRAMDRSLRAADENLLSYTLWNYTSDNDNTHGDQWNGEDLSIFSQDVNKNPGLADIHAGGRALQAVVRPYPRATAGEPLSLSFDINRRIFIYEFRHDPAIQAPTVIFVPDYQYPNGYDAWISDGDCEIRKEEQILVYRHTNRRETHRIRITPR
ncbi:MAG: hypothetical protein EHM21_12270 [Chloroflexi bacterium]|nr:MAG: hypothetical protein EHM21_12270 [Chloroflexota bacterium]